MVLLGRLSDFSVNSRKESFLEPSFELGDIPQDHPGSQSSERLSTSPAVLQYRALEHWDGKLPEYNAGQLPMLTFDLSKGMGGDETTRLKQLREMLAQAKPSSDAPPPPAAPAPPGGAPPAPVAPTPATPSPLSTPLH